MSPEILWCAAPDETALREQLTQLIRNANVAPGASAAVAVRVGGVFHGFQVTCGSKRWDGIEPIVGDELYDLASVTKSLFALVVARQVQRGDLRFEASLESYLSISKNTHAGSASVESLLAHRAGLQAHIEFFAPLRTAEVFEREQAFSEAVNAACAKASTEPVYSDLGYLLLGEALREHSGQDFLGDLVCQELQLLGLDQVAPLRLLGRKQTPRLVPTETVSWRGGEICGQIHDDNAFAIAGTDMCGHAGLFGTSQAVLRFACTLLAIDADEHPQMSARSVAELLRRRPGGTLRAGFDGKTPADSSAGRLLGAESFGHLGFTGTSFWCDPEQQIAVVLLCNRVCPTRENTRIQAARPIVHDALVEQAQLLRRSLTGESLSSVV